MTVSNSSAQRALFVAAVTSMVFAGQAGAQKNSTPSGWVGLSVIQHGHGESGAGVTIDYPVVASVEPGSPAQTAGLVAGDTILAYNDVDAHADPAGVQRFLQAGKQIVVKIRRNGVRSLRLTVARRTASNVYREGVTISADDGASMPLISSVSDGSIAVAASVAPGRMAPFAGAYFAQLNAGLASALKVRNIGVLVVSVGNGSAAMRSGLEAGDVITRADSIAVLSPMGIATAVRLASDQSILLDVTRHGKPQKVTISW